MKEITEVVLDNSSSLHSHLREGPLLDITVPLNHPYSCVVHIPNTKNPVDSGERLRSHQKEIMARIPTFQIIWGIMLTKRTSRVGIKQAHNLGASFIKYIPADTSTNSGLDTGITLDELPEYFDKLDYGFSLGMASLNHIERIRTRKGTEIPFEHREEEAIPDVDNLIRCFPGRKIRIEHISTKKMIDFLRDKSGIKMAFTPQHARKTYSQVSNAFGNIIQENFCMPILKPYTDMIAVRQEIISGNYDNCRYGPDDAIHPWRNKLKGIPGVFLPPFIALPILCEIFERYGNLVNLTEFVRFREEDEKFFGVKLEKRKRIVLEKKIWIVPETILGRFVPFLRGEKLNWRIKEVINF